MQKNKLNFKKHNLNDFLNQLTDKSIAYKNVTISYPASMDDKKQYDKMSEYFSFTPKKEFNYVANKKFFASLKTAELNHFLGRLADKGQFEYDDVTYNFSTDLINRLNVIYKDGREVIRHILKYMFLPLVEKIDIRSGQKYYDVASQAFYQDSPDAKMLEEFYNKCYCFIAFILDIDVEDFLKMRS